MQRQGRESNGRPSRLRICRVEEEPLKLQLELFLHLAGSAGPVVSGEDGAAAVDVGASGLARPIASLCIAAEEGGSRVVGI